MDTIADFSWQEKGMSELENRPIEITQSEGRAGRRKGRKEGKKEGRKAGRGGEEKKEQRQEEKGKEGRKLLNSL